MISQEAALLAQVRKFIEQYGASRFQDLDTKQSTCINRVGFRRTRDDGKEEFVAMPEMFRTEIIKGFSLRWAAPVLRKAGWLQGSGRNNTRTQRLPGMGVKATYTLCLPDDETVQEDMLVSEDVLCQALVARLKYARGKHIWRKGDRRAKTEALAALCGEVHELMDAINKGEGLEREKDEALDVMAVAARIWFGDYLDDTQDADLSDAKGEIEHVNNKYIVEKFFVRNCGDKPGLYKKMKDGREIYIGPQLNIEFISSSIDIKEI